MVNRPTFWAFETAKRAVSNAQLGLDTVGHNISNIDSPGYTRQRVDQVSYNITGMSKYVINKQFYTGMGAVATGVSQIRDPFLDARYRTENSDFGEYVVKQSGIYDISKIFDELNSDTGLAEGMGALIEAITKAMTSPTDTEFAMEVRARAQEFAKTLNIYSNDLDKVLTQNHNDLNTSIVDELNPMLKELAHLNEQIFQTEIYGNPANELKDRRNLLLDELSGFVDIEIREVDDAHLAKKGIKATHVTVLLKDSADANGDPIVLVDEDKAGQFNYSKDGDKAKITFTDHNGMVHDHAATDPTGQNRTIIDRNLKNGALRGYLDVINGDGDVGLNNPRGIVYARNYIDDLARKFAEVMNGTNAQNVSVADIIAAGKADYMLDPNSPVNDPSSPQYNKDKPVYIKDTNGNAILYKLNPSYDESVDPPSARYERDPITNEPIVYDLKAPGEPGFEGSYGGTLLKNSLNQDGEIMTNPLTGLPYTEKDLGISADEKIVYFAAGTTDPPSASDVYDPLAGITAGNIGLTDAWRFDSQEIVLSMPSNLSADTTPIGRFIDALDKAEYSGVIPGQTPMNFYDTIVNFQAIIGLDLSEAKNLLSTSQRVLGTVDDQRQSISGVLENEEAVDMMKYSNHYNAASRYMTALDEALNTIINGMGLVGR